MDGPSMLPRQAVAITQSLNIQDLNILAILSAVPLPLLFAPYSLTRQIDMYGSAMEDIRYSYGTTLIGLVLAAMCAFSPFFSLFPAELATL